MTRDVAAAEVAALAADDSHRPPVVMMVDELRANLREDGRRMNASGELRRLDDGDGGGGCAACGRSICNSARADADRARPPALIGFWRNRLADCKDCGGGGGACTRPSTAASPATAKIGLAVACNGM